MFVNVRWLLLLVAIGWFVSSCCYCMMLVFFSCLFVCLFVVV